MDTTSPTGVVDVKDMTERALLANISHQHALTKRTEHLETELKELERLMNAAPGEADDDLDLEVQIPDATKAMGPCATSEFLNPNSPFFKHASQRVQWLDCIINHPMKTKELEALENAVRDENLRLQAYDTQRRGHTSTIHLEYNTDGIDWNIVAQKVSSASSVKRTADQCRIKWLGDRHPMINHGDWSPNELESLKHLVSAQQGAMHGKVDWVQISKELRTNRTPLDCMRQGIPRERHAWTSEAEERLAKAVELYGINNWSVVARYVSEHATAAQCQVRYSRAIDPTHKRGPWTEEELNRLELAVAAYGNSWMEVATCIPGRTNEQCRDRWTEHRSISSAEILWSEMDDQALLDAVASMGNRWTAIAVKIGNRSIGQQCQARYKKLKRRQGTAVSATPSLVSSEILAGEPQLTEIEKETEPDGQTDVPNERKRTIAGTPDSTSRKRRKIAKSDDVPSTSKRPVRSQKYNNQATTESFSGTAESSNASVPLWERPRPRPRGRARKIVEGPSEEAVISPQETSNEISAASVLPNDPAEFALVAQPGGHSEQAETPQVSAQTTTNVEVDDAVDSVAGPRGRGRGTRKC